MPIEIQIEKQFGKSLPAREVMEKARTYASAQIEKQKARLPAPRCARRLGQSVQDDEFHQRSGRNPRVGEDPREGLCVSRAEAGELVFRLRFALAEAEVEYQDKVDPTIDVLFTFAEPEKTAQAFGLHAMPKQEGGIVIWTTTPWTIPANQALNVHPEIVYSLVDTEKGLLILAEDRVEECLKQYSLTGSTIATTTGEKFSGLRFHHPLSAAHPGYKRTAPVYLGDYVTTESGTGIVHSSPAYGVEDFVSCKAHGMTDSDIINPVMGDGRYIESLPLFGGLSIWEANDQIVEALRGAKSLLKTEKYTHSYMHCWRHKTPIIYRATSQWFAGMDVKPNDTSRTLRETALRRHREHARSFPSWGKQRLSRDRRTGRTGRCRVSANGACRWRSSSTRKPANCIRVRWNCLKKWPSAWK